MHLEQSYKKCQEVELECEQNDETIKELKRQIDSLENNLRQVHKTIAKVPEYPL